ncbi:cytochrome P450 [Rhizodiscina lignyota]|uniref:Cytochrome P450 n=1 Tax=Rhizodiscina lignyota TaxID=1504668 RepID=A0A9P4ISR0_9PEZI|nr:cytochrome P450 [Rhizodiscina lignyota]
MILPIAIVFFAAFFILFIQPVLVYFLDKKHLRKFPAPAYAGLSSLWRISHNLRRQHYQAIHNAHQQLGTHVRIGPNHISVSDPLAMNDIYGHGANMLKEGFYDGGAGEFRNLADARVKAEHQRKRRMLAHIFAQKTIVSLEPMVRGTITALVEQVDKHAADERPINLRRYMNYFTIDFFSQLVYGESLGCVRRGNDIVTAETKDGKVYQVPFIKSLHEAMIMNTALAIEAPLLPITKKLFKWHPYARSGLDYENVIYHKTSKRLQKPEAQDDIFAKFMKSMNSDPGMPIGEVLAECSVLMNGGTDTTAAALTNTIYLLYKHPATLRKLRAELGDAIGDVNLPSYDQVSQLPYLRACIEESLRLRPASSMGLPRIVPKGGRVIAGKFIEEDVTVSVPTYTLLRDPQAFDEPERYNPDRWIDGDREKMSKAHLPFSTGPRACIGRNIAYFEQLLVIATLVHSFDFEFESPDFKLEIAERFNSNPGEMFVTCHRRSQ